MIAVIKYDAAIDALLAVSGGRGLVDRGKDGSGQGIVHSRT